MKCGHLWRSGANEPTIVHLPVAVTIAGIPVEPGSYLIYTIPGESERTVIVNGSITQWGHESRCTGAPNVHAEDFTIQAMDAEGGADLVLRWERTRVTNPVRRT